jgi:hypothetical protein
MNPNGTSHSPLRPSEQRRAQSRVSKQMEYNLEQARNAWIASETQDETLRRVGRPLKNEFGYADNNQTGPNSYWFRPPVQPYTLINGDAS